MTRTFARRCVALAVSCAIVAWACLETRGEPPAAGTAAQRNDVVAGQFIVEPPTLICLGFEWYIDGDDNRNATVQVSYRKRGDKDWRQALPLLRIRGERTFYPRLLPREYVAPNMFAGSILDLAPDTEYECRFLMSDPDGVKGVAEKALTVRTRGEPKAFEGGRTFHVYPPDYEGEKEEAAFTNLKEAYFGLGGGDWSIVAPPRVQPGDTILVHAGLYKSDRLSYRDPMKVPFHGTYVLTQTGTPEKPIVIRAAGDGEVIFDGAGAYRLFDVTAADYHYFEGLTIRNTDVAFYAGLKNVIGCNGLVVRRCRMTDIGIGVMAQYADHKNFYIADNVMIGRNDPYRLLGWARPGPYGASAVRSYYGIKVYGRGHVICHNHVAHFHDGICICTHGLPEPERNRKCVAIDIYNNDVFHMCDDFIEADGGVHNIRVLRNRGFNSGQCGLSGQPVYGGPAYYIRNILYNVPTGVALKFNVNPSGLLVYQNTFITEWRNGAYYSNADVRNNLFLGRDQAGRPILLTGTYTSYTTFDHNGYRPNRHEGPQFAWASPAPGTLREYDRKKLQSGKFKTLEEFRQAAGQEPHGVIVDYDVFQHVTRPDPNRPYAVYRHNGMDFRLRPGTAAVDAGCVLPGVNDAFTGSAPDLGAYELGKRIPVYGPRKSRE